MTTLSHSNENLQFHELPLISESDSAIAQLSGSRDNLAQTDSDGDGVPNQIEALADANDLNFVRFMDPGVENQGGGAEHPIPVLPSKRVELGEYIDEWDADQDGIPDPFDPDPGEGTWDHSAGDVWDRDIGKPEEKRFDFGDVPADRPVDLDLGLEPQPAVQPTPKPPSIPALPATKLRPPSLPQSSGRGQRGRGF